MPDKPSLDFYYEFASTYSYLTAMRIDGLAGQAGVAVAWRPFLLGPIFAAQGWTTSPFNLYPAKGRYMVRDIERIAKARGRTFVMPAVFPANGLAAARIALSGEAAGWTNDFSRRVYEAQFEHAADISNVDVLASLLKGMNLDPVTVLAQANAPETKDRLRAQSARAAELGVFGAPSFITPDGELFWGDDRLEHALAWTLGHKPG